MKAVYLLSQDEMNAIYAKLTGIIFMLSKEKNIFLCEALHWAEEIRDILFKEEK